MGRTIIDDRARHQRPQPQAERRMYRSRPLTEKQAAILNGLRIAIEILGKPLRLITIARLFRTTAPAVKTILKALRDKGYLSMAGDQTRTIQLTGKT